MFSYIPPTNVQINKFILSFCRLIPQDARPRPRPQLPPRRLSLLLLLFSSSTDLDRLNKKTTKAIMIRTYRQDTLTMYMYMFLLCIYFAGSFFVNKANKVQSADDVQISRRTTNKQTDHMFGFMNACTFCRVSPYRLYRIFQASI